MRRSPASLFATISHSFGTQAAMVVLNLMFGILLARSLGPERKGAHDLLVNTNALFLALLGLSLPAGITYAVARARVALDRMLRWLAVSAFIQVVGAVALLVMADRVGVGSVFVPAADRTVMFLFCGVYFFSTTTAGYFRAVLVGQQNILTANHITLGGRVFDLCLLGGLVAGLRGTGLPFGLFWIMLYLLASSLFSNALFLGRLIPLKDSRGGGESGMRTAIFFSIPSHIGNLAQFMNYRLDVFLVNLFVGQGAVGLYVLAAGMAQLLWMLPSSAAVILLPRIAGRQVEFIHDASMVNRLTRLFLWVCVFGGAVLCALGVRLIPVLYGRAFAGSVPAFLALIPGTVLFAPVHVLAAYIAGIGRPSVNMAIAFLALVVTVSLDVTLIPRLGIVGAGLASTASYSVTTVATAWMYLRLSGSRWRDIIVITAEDRQWLGHRLRDALRRPSAA